MSSAAGAPQPKVVSGSNLGNKLLADTGAALGASFCVAPFITIVDRSIMQNASGVMKMTDSMKAGLKELVLKPTTFLRRPEFAMVWGLYSATYITANYINTVCESREVDPGWPKFLGTTVVNMSACIAKDKAFTQMFGTGKPKPLPIPSYVLFAMRDAGTVAASFNLPGPVAQQMQQRYNMELGRAEVVAQLVCPAAVQFLSTPLHLIALDLYNRPGEGASSRAAFVAKNYTPSVIARIMRIGPAFGLGGVGNTAFRKKLRAMLTPST